MREEARDQPLGGSLRASLNRLWTAGADIQGRAGKTNA
jgi:hypothetical protein